MPELWPSGSVLLGFMLLSPDAVKPRPWILETGTMRRRTIWLAGGDLQAWSSRP